MRAKRAEEDDDVERAERANDENIMRIIRELLGERSRKQIRKLVRSALR